MDLFDLITPDPKPEKPSAPSPRPAPGGHSGSPPLSLGGLADADSGADGESFKSKFAAHQEHLAGRRATLLQNVLDWKEAEQPMRETFASALVGQTHRADWDELWPLFEAIQQMPVSQRSCVVILGGWFMDRKKLMAEPVQTPQQLRRDLFTHALHQEVLDRIGNWQHAYDVQSKAVSLRAVEALARQHAKVFGQCFQSADWFNALWDYAQEQQSHLLGLVLDQLFSLRQPVFWFYPTPERLTAGWQDFWSFAWAYQRLPSRERDALGPYFFTLRQSQPRAVK
jgi:hypothetical protein